MTETSRAADGGAGRTQFLWIGRAQWRDAWAGLKAIAPLMPGSVLFGMAFGALVRVAGIDPITGNLASVTVVAGASQIAIVEALRANAPGLIAILTALIVNARFALYSAALAPVFADFPLRWKLGLAHLTTDQSAVTALNHAHRYPDPVARRWFVVGGALPFVAVWSMGTALGIALGPVIPDEWQIGFVVPMMFIAVMVPGLRSLEGVVGLAVTSGVVLAARGLPFGLNVIVGILAGILVGSLVGEARDWRRRRRADAGPPAEAT